MTDRYHSSQDNTQGMSYTENRDTYPERLAYIASQKDQDGIEIGTRSAAKMIRDKGPQYEDYMKAFESKNLPPQRMLNHNFDYQKTIREYVPESNLQESYRDVQARGEELMGSDANIDKQAQREYQLESINNGVNIESAEKRVLESGNAKQDLANQAAKDRLDSPMSWFGKNKDTKEEFKK